MWTLLWTSDLYAHKVAVLRDGKVWDLKIEEKEKMARGSLYLARAEKKNFLTCLNGQEVFCSEELSLGRDYLVSIQQESRGEKLPRVTTKVEIASQNLVYLPREAGINISRKIADPEKREAFRSLWEEAGGEGGILFRSSAADESPEDLREEVKEVLGTWEEIQKKEKAREKAALWKSSAWMQEILEKYPEAKTSYEEDFEEKEALERLYQADGRRLDSYFGEKSLWEQKVAKELLSLCEARVDLERGVYLFFERTHACVTIDVNTLEVSPSEANRMAAREIPRQLRLRNWGGIVIVDFIDAKLSEREGLVKLLKAGFKREFREIQWGGFQDFYLCTFTKQRRGQEIERLYAAGEFSRKVLDFEAEMQELLAEGEEISSIAVEKNLWQTWKNKTKCGIKNSVEPSFLKEGEAYKIQIKK